VWNIRFGAFIARRSSGKKIKIVLISNLNYCLSFYTEGFKLKVLFGRSHDGDNRGQLCACALLFNGMTTSDPRVTELFALYSLFHYSRIVEISCITKERPTNEFTLRTQLAYVLLIHHPSMCSSFSLTREIAKVLNTCIWNTIERRN